EEEGFEPVALKRAAKLDSLPAGQPFAFEAQKPALVARGLAEAENELAAFVRAGQRVVVAFPHLGEALRQQNVIRRVEAAIDGDHEDHGVGKLIGFETKEVAGVTRDYLFLGFRGDDRLYVPHEQLGKVSRYIGADSSVPALSKLGGKAWENLKNRARASVRELAGALLALYAQRQQAP